MLDQVEIKPYFFDLKSKRSCYAEVLFEEFFHELDTGGNTVISKVELFHHIWELQYLNGKYEDEI